MSAAGSGVSQMAGAPVICETPDPAADIDWLRAHVPGAD